VTNTPQQNFGTLQITKTIGGAGGVASGTTFSGSYDCGTGFSGPFSGLTPTAPVTIPNIPVGRSCTVTETTPTGGLVDSSYAWDVTGTVNPAAVTIANGQTATLNITNKTKRVYGADGHQAARRRRTAAADRDLQWHLELRLPDRHADDTNGTWTVTYTTGIAGDDLHRPRVADPSRRRASCRRTHAVELDLRSRQPVVLVEDAGHRARERHGQLRADSVPFTVTNTAQRTSHAREDRLVAQWRHGGRDRLEPEAAGDAGAGGATLSFDTGQTKYIASGVYTLDEAAGVRGLQPHGLACSSTAEPSSTTSRRSRSPSPNGATVVCQFTNTDSAPKLTLVKNVDNKGGVGSADASAWALSATSAGTPR
jgi:hypothetical protein